MVKDFTQLTRKLGQLLGPAPVAEIVITLYENQQINYQIEGMQGPVTPQQAYQLLATVAQQIATPSTQETPQP